MLVEHEETDKHGSFYVEENKEKVAEMTYSLSDPGKMVIKHTHVDQKLRGKNVGLQLVRAAAKYSKKNNIRIVPLCSFAMSVFEKNDDLKEMLYVD